MSFQYIHTSAKRGLEPGKSGFCCVARDRDIPPDLIQEFEQQSRYSLSSKGESPIVLRYRIVSLRSGVYHILSRIQDSGADYSKRNNHIAHHLAFAKDELSALPNPATILLDWKKWRHIWDEPPRILESSDAFNLKHLKSKKAAYGSIGDFPPAVKYGEVLSRAFEISADEELHLVEHFRDSLKELRFKEQWRYAFTSALLPTDRPGDYIWSGVWKGISLPYEIDYHPKPLGKKAKPKAPAHTRSPAAETSEENPSEANFLKQAPKVEIPAEFDRKKRRRPKRRFSERELSKSINYALALSTLLCIAIASYFYWRNQEDVDTLIDEKRGLATQKKESPTKLAISAWDRFAVAGYPASDLAAIRPQAETLTLIGDTQPIEIVAFLELLSSEEPIAWPASETVPPPLVEVAPLGDGAQLSVSPSDYPRLSMLALIPSDVAESLRDLEAYAANPEQTLDSQVDANYRADQWIAALRSFEDKANQTVFAISPEASQAIEAFLQKKEALLANESFQPFLAIHRAFDLPDSAAYVAFDSDGLLATGSESSFAAYSVRVFADHALANFESLKNTVAFRGAFSRVNGSSLASPFEAAQIIYEAMQTAEPTTPLLQAKWSEMRDAWEQAFVRSDLMEETIVAYTIEALEIAKSDLAALQSQFSRADLAARKDMLAFSEQVDAAAKLALSVSKSEEWVVFDKQTAKVAPQSP